MDKEHVKLGAFVTFLGGIFSGLHQFMEWSEASSYLREEYGKPIEILVWAALSLVLFVATLRFLHCFEIVGAGADTSGSYYREKFDLLRQNLADYKNTKDEYSKRLKRFLARVDRFFGDAGSMRALFCKIQRLCGPRRLTTAVCFSLFFILFFQSS